MNKFIKFLCLLTTVMSGGASAVAQTSQIAVLFHEGAITNYTSATALQQALEAAADGDVITLSSGLFQAADITKNVSIRGAGMGYPELGGTTAPTILTGNFSIDCPESDAHHLYLEGIVNNETVKIVKANSLTTLKCQFSKLYRNNDQNEWNNFKFVHCVIDDIYQPRTTSLHFVNCAIKKYDLSSSPTDQRSAQFDNCVIYAGGSVEKSSLTNCVLIFEKGSATYATASATSSFSHCIIVGCDRFQAVNVNNSLYPKDKATAIFKADGLFNLADDLTGFAGTDGGQIGIHGGSLPFTPVTTNLKITKFKVAERTTADGKLPIEISIESY